MKYDQEIEREIELEAQDFVDLFRDQEAVDAGTRIYMKKIEFLHAIGRLDPVHQMSDERREELRSDDLSIETVEMEDDIPQDERDDTYDRLLRRLSLDGNMMDETVVDEYGEWAVDRLKSDERVSHHPETMSFSWDRDRGYNG